MENLSRYCKDTCTCRHCTPKEWRKVKKTLLAKAKQDEETFSKSDKQLKEDSSWNK